MDEATERNEPESIPADARAIEESLDAVGVVKSTTHGRIRMQLRREYRTPEAMASIKAQLEQDKRVQEVTVNERTGSVTVKYGVEHHGHGLLWQAVQEAELIGAATLDLPEEEEGESAEAGGGTYGKLDRQLADIMYKLDLGIYRRTNGRIHPRGRVFPLLIAGLGVAQMAIYGISLEMLPGPLLIWLAHDIHVKFGQEPPMLVAPKPAAAGDTTAKTGGSTAAGTASASTGGVAPAAA